MSPNLKAHCYRFATRCASYIFVLYGTASLKWLGNTS